MDLKLQQIKGVPLNGEAVGVNTAVALFEVAGQRILRGGVAHPEVLRELNEELEQLCLPERPVVIAGGRIIVERMGDGFVFGIGNSIGNDVPKDRQKIIEFVRRCRPTAEIVELSVV